jgi:lia operon protein LiaF
MKPRSKLIWGIVLVILGIILLGETTGAFSVEDLFDVVFPLALILIGVWLIFRRRSTDKADRYAPPPPPPPPSATFEYPSESQPPADDTDTAAEGPQAESSHTSRNYEEPRMTHAPSSDEAGKLKYSKTFGDMFIDCVGVNLQSVEVSAGFGDLDIRLNGGVLGDGLNRLIISSFIGDIRIFAPADMPIFAHCSNFVGDIEIMGKRASGFGNSIDSQTTNYQESPKKLYVACNSFIGDIKFYGA